MKDIPTYDCHNKSHFQVKDEFENWLLLNNVPMDVITGNSEEMKKIVIDILLKHDYGFFISQYNQGSIKVI